MKTYQQDFLKLALERQALCFGEFTLKSGRNSPYFFNAGLFNTGSDLAQLGRFYAQAIIESGVEFDVLFGPAYKGIPLAASTAIALSEYHQRDVPYCFNRKEAKDHGEGGNLVGAPLEGRILLIDDVITAGTAIRESVDLIKAHGAQAVGVSIALDRQERGKGARSAIQEVESDLGLQVISLVDLQALITYLQTQAEGAKWAGAMQAYQAAYGVKPIGSA